MKSKGRVKDFIRSIVLAFIAASVLPGSLLEIQYFRLHLRLTSLQSLVLVKSLIANVAYAQFGKAGSQRVGTGPKLYVRRKQNPKLIY